MWGGNRRRPQSPQRRGSHFVHPSTPNGGAPTQSEPAPTCTDASSARLWGTHRAIQPAQDRQQNQGSRSSATARLAGGADVVMAARTVEAEVRLKIGTTVEARTMVARTVEARTGTTVEARTGTTVVARTGVTEVAAADAIVAVDKPSTARALRTPAQQRIPPPLPSGRLRWSCCVGVAGGPAQTGSPCPCPTILQTTQPCR